MAAMGHAGWNQPPSQYAANGPPAMHNNGSLARTGSNGALDTAAVITLRQLLSGEEVAYLFGSIAKEQQLVEQLRQQTGAGVVLSEPGAHERVLTLTGPLDIVSKAFTLVCRKLWELVTGEMSGGNSSTRMLVVRLAVPAVQCGSIIGKAGARIREIRELTGANMNVAQESLPESTERCVEIIGSGECCLQTVYQVCCVLQEIPLKGEVVPYYPRALIGDMPPPPPPSATAAWKPIILTAHRAYAIENGMAVLVSPERLRSELELILGTQLGPLSSCEASPMLPDYMNPIALLSVLAQPHKLAGGGPEISREMRIENEVAGSVIGRLGSKVAEIRKISGASVNVNTADEVTAAGERVVSIRGSPESVMLAQFLVQSNIDLYKKDLVAKGAGSDFGGPPQPPPMAMQTPQLPMHDGGGGFDFGDQIMDPVGHRGFVFGRGGSGGGGPPPPQQPSYSRGGGGGRGGGGAMFGRGGPGRGSPMDGGRGRGGHIGGLRARGRRR